MVRDLSDDLKRAKDEAIDTSLRTERLGRRHSGYKNPSGVCASGCLWTIRKGMWSKQ